jgi:hypothetical protein
VSGGFVRWEPDEQGRLWSEVLGLWLVDHAGELRAQRLDESFLVTPNEAEQQRKQQALARQQAEMARQREMLARQQAEEARLRAEEARRQAEADREREALARQQAEAEITRLRAELERRQGH